MRLHAQLIVPTFEGAQSEEQVDRWHRQWSLYRKWS